MLMIRPSILFKGNVYSFRRGNSVKFKIRLSPFKNRVHPKRKELGGEHIFSFQSMSLEEACRARKAM